MSQETINKFCPMRQTACNEHCGMFDTNIKKCVIFGFNSNLGLIARELTELNNRLKAHLNYLVNKREN